VKVFIQFFQSLFFTHSRYILTTVTPGLNLPEHTEVGMVDGEEFVYYDSNIGKVIPRTAWIKKVDGDDADYWNRETQRNQATQETFKANVQTAMQRFNHTKGNIYIYTHTHTQIHSNSCGHVHTTQKGTHPHTHIHT
uniref:MHC class I-like antigen recognition-like domain-containing protein n=1 Tax=Astyanax mexicanus TaxID=7994 RepID=A0A8B9JCJ0_ASTMX